MSALGQKQTSWREPRNVRFGPRADVAAALQGLGILYAYDDEGVNQALEQGLLKRILVDWSPMRPGLFLYYPNRRHTQRVLRAFIDCLLDRDLVSAKRPVRT